MSEVEPIYRLSGSLKVNCVIHPTFYEAAVAKHLVNEDEEWDRCLKEATQVQFPTALCELFSLFVFIIILLMQENYMKNTRLSSIIPNIKKVLVKILH